MEERKNSVREKKNSFSEKLRIPKGTFDFIKICILTGNLLNRSVTKEKHLPYITDIVIKNSLAHVFGNHYAYNPHLCTLGT